MTHADPMPVPPGGVGPGMARLLAIVEVERADAVQCQHQGCNHRVYKRIHVVDDAGKLLVLGSTCFEKRYGSGVALGRPSYGGDNGTRLSAEERQLLVDNTSKFIDRFRLQYEESRQQFKAKLQVLRMPLQGGAAYGPRPQIAPASLQYLSKRPPWPWVMPGCSVAYFHLTDGPQWVRVRDTQSAEMLMPWPSFDGWDEVFPASVGVPDTARGGYRVKDIAHAVSYLRERSQVVRVGNWAEVVP